MGVAGLNDQMNEEIYDGFYKFYDTLEPEQIPREFKENYDKCYHEIIDRGYCYSDVCNDFKENICRYDGKKILDRMTPLISNKSNKCDRTKCHLTDCINPYTNRKYKECTSGKLEMDEVDMINHKPIGMTKENRIYPWSELDVEEWYWDKYANDRDANSYSDYYYKNPEYHLGGSYRHER